MSAPAATDVLIVGAGPGGSAAAIRLARLGLQVHLLDRAHFPRDKTCSEYLSPEAVRHLDTLGVLATLDGAGGHPLTGTTVFGPDGSKLTGLFAQAGGAPFRGTGLSIARRILDAELVAEAVRAGATLSEGVTVRELLYDGGEVAGVVAEGGTSDTKVLRARLVIGADGLRSTVARRLGRRRHGIPDRLAFVAHVADVSQLGNEAEMHVGRDGYVGLNPIGGGVANVALVVPRPRAEEAKGDPTAFLYRELERFPGVVGRVDPRRERRGVQVTGPFAASSARLTAPGALLLGDAAEFFDPFTGEGILSAFRGAELAAETVGRALERTGKVTDRSLADYRLLYRRTFAGQRAVERLIGWGMFLPSLFDRAVGRLAARDLGHTLVGVTGGLLPARKVLAPSFLLRMLL
jgi:flavin-dependent dehydrogenase